MGQITMGKLANELRSRLQYKLILPFLGLTLVVVLAGSSLALWFSLSAIEESSENQLRTVSRIAQEAMANQESAQLGFLREAAFSAANPQTGAPSVVSGLADQDQLGLKAALEPYFMLGAARDDLVLDRLIAFDTAGRTLVDVERSGDQTLAYEAQDLSSLQVVQWVLSGATDERGDKYAGLFFFGDTQALYFASIVPVRDGDSIVGGLISAARIDSLLQLVQARSQAAAVTLYAPEGPVLGTTYAEGGAPDYSSSAEGPLLPPLNAATPLATAAVEPTERPSSTTVAPLSPTVIAGVLNPGSSPEALEVDPQSSPPSGVIFGREQVGGREYGVVYRQLLIRGEPAGILGTSLSHDYVIANWVGARNSVLLLSGTFALAVITVGVFVARQITRPLQRLTRAARAVAAGDLATRSDVRSTDEIGELASSFDTMTINLRQLYAQVQAEASQRAAIVESLSDGVIVCTPDGRIGVVNRAARVMLGLSLDEPLPAFLADIQLTRVNEPLPGVPVSLVADLHRLNGHLLRVNTAPVVDETGVETGYVTLLHDVTDELALEARVSNLTRANEAIYHALSQGLAVHDVAAIARYTRPELPLGLDGQLPEGLDAAMTGFDQVSVNLREYRATTAPALQRDLVLQAIQELEGVAAQAKALAEPFGSLLSLMVERWRPVLSEEGGRLARTVLAGPVPNPYVAGNPVEGELFIGREDTMRRLHELWSGQSQWPSVIIYGHRRMGKTSILRNLEGQFGATTVVVNFNLQRFGMVQSTGDLLYQLALRIFDALPDTVQQKLEEPDEDRFLTRNAFGVFDLFLETLGEVRGELRIIIAIDEFEKIEEFIEAVRLEPQILDTLRGWIQTYPWFVLALAGLHRLEEMTHEYWNPLFGSVTLIPVSFLAPAGARRLITQPSPDFALNYSPEAVEQIIALTNGQPYLIQRIGHALVTLFNRQTFEEGIERERCFSADDVAAVISAPEFFLDGNGYFSGVWNQALQSRPDGQTAILMALARLPEGATLDVLAGRTGLLLEQAHSALQTLVTHDVVVNTGGVYGFAVELMRRWVIETHVPNSAGMPLSHDISLVRAEEE